MDTIITYLTEHKVVLVGATSTTLEILTLIINFWRGLRAKQKVQIMGTTCTCKPKTKLQSFAWAANPVNLFRKA